MTNILRRILPNHAEVQAKHSAIENKKFLQRYINKTEELTLLDHYRHLVQLREIYRTFYQILTSEHFKPVVPEHLHTLLQRANHIDEDLCFLRSRVVTNDKDNIHHSTQAYVKFLLQLENNQEKLMHFLVSLLGDLNGGQFLKHIVRDLYLKHKLITDKNTDNGTRFYQFEKGIAQKLTEWLQSFITFNQDINNPIINEASLLRGRAVLDAFNMQADIIEELEQTRRTGQQHFQFFTCPSLPTAAIAVAATVTTAVTISLWL